MVTSARRKPAARLLALLGLLALGMPRRWLETADAQPTSRPQYLTAEDFANAARVPIGKPARVELHDQHFHLKV